MCYYVLLDVLDQLLDGNGGVCGGTRPALGTAEQSKYFVPGAEQILRAQCAVAQYHGSST
jgi:hypothetical protein